jgi:hypothetical protein
MTRSIPGAGMFTDPGVEQEIWQRRAAAQLPGVLEAGRGLPPAAWTIGTAGATLAGRLPRPRRRTSQRAAFEAWRQALGLTRRVSAHDQQAQEQPIGTYLSASGTIGGVRVHLSATIVHDDHDDHDGVEDADASEGRADA